MRRLVEDRARHLGFCGLRITRPDRVPHLPERLAHWLAEGAHGTMDWMEERADQRASPVALWPGVRSILVVAMSYRPEEDPWRSSPGAGTAPSRPTPSGAIITKC